MTYSKRQLYAQGEPIGDSATEAKPGGRVYGGGGSGGGGTTTSVQNIPDELKPLASAYASKAIDLSNSGFTPYTADRYADLNGTQNQALDMVTNRATNGSETMNLAEKTLQNTLAGGQTNPYLDSLVSKAQSSVVDNFNNMVKPQTESAMVRSGSFGNAGLDETLQNQQKAAASQMGDIATSMYGAAYDGDKARQAAALQLAPTYGNQAYTDADRLLQAGNVKQDAVQQDKDFDFSQFQEAQNDPYKKLSAMSGVFGTQLGGSSTSTNSGGGGK